jgi:hypothetical protein
VGDYCGIATVYMAVILYSETNKEPPMLKTISLSLLAFSIAIGAEAAAKSPADVLFDKAVADNAKDAEKAYEQYQKALDAANAKVLKALDAAKKDLNDPKKGKLTIQERAKALEELDARIKELKDGAIGSLIAAKSKESGDLLGDKEKKVDAKPDPKSPIIGKWLGTAILDNKGFRRRCEFFKDGTGLADTCWRFTWKLGDNNTYILTYNDPKYPKLKPYVAELKDNGLVVTTDKDIAEEYISDTPPGKTTK